MYVERPGFINRLRNLCSKASRRGSELVEVSLVVVPLFGITFLILDISMVLFLRSTFQNAVREGVRYGITGANDTGPCQDDSIKQVVKIHSLGFLKSTAAASKIHVHFMSPVDGSLTDNSPGNIMSVTVEGYKYGPLAPFQRIGMTPLLYAQSYGIVEPYPGTNPCLTKKE
jgi:hypothetical protein